MKEMFKRASGWGKVAVLAAVAALALVAASPALAKTVNTVKEALSYVGSLAIPILEITNNGHGPGLSIKVGKKKAPLTVNPGAGTATGLSADKLDGKDSTDFASGVDYYSKEDGVNLPEFPVAIRSITVSAPTAGYVILIGDGVFLSNHDGSAEIGAHGSVFLTKVFRAQAGHGDQAEVLVPATAVHGQYRTSFSLTEVFPVNAGDTTFYMTGRSTGNVRVQEGSLTGEFIKNRLQRSWKASGWPGPRGGIRGDDRLKQFRERFESGLTGYERSPRARSGARRKAATRSSASGEPGPVGSVREPNP